MTRDRPAFGLPVLLASAWLLLPLPAPVADAAVVTGSWTVRAETCTMTLQEEDGLSYRLRVFQVRDKMTTPCLPSAEAFADAFQRVMQAAAPFRKQGRETVRVFLGRLIELPELSKEVSSTARQAKEWDLAAGKPIRGDVNVFVARLLLKSDVLRELLGGLPLVRVTVEKVLVPSRDMVTRWKRGAPYPNKRVPYDCLLWVEVGPPR